jgi:predicted nucleic acid-binding Zn ribbon protein
MKKIIELDIITNKERRTECCIVCKKKYSVDSMNDFHWRGFCSKNCKNGVNKKSPPPQRKICLFCKKNLTSKVVFCSKDCKISFNKNRKSK